MTRERAKEMLPIIAAFAEGKEVEFKVAGSPWESSENLSFGLGDTEYRIKPTPTLRPWKAEEVPVGCLIRKKVLPQYKYMVIYADDAGIPFPGIRPDWKPLRKIMENYQHSTDNGKTWLPCGVLE